MDNVYPDHTKYQCFTSKIGEALGGYVFVGNSKCTRSAPKPYDPELKVAREWKSDNVLSLICMIHDWVS